MDDLKLPRMQNYLNKLKQSAEGTKMLYPGAEASEGVLSEIERMERKILQRTSDLKTGEKVASDFIPKRLGKYSGLLGKLGKAGIVASALGAGSKAMAGDFTGAASDAGELAYDIAEPLPLTAAAPTMMGNAELPPEEMEERQKYNALMQKIKGR
jgi:hypothetical protein